MRFEQTRDVLEHVKRFHEEVNKYYQRLENRAEKQRVRMLLDYLRQRQEDLRKAVTGFERETPGKVLDTWFQYAHDVQRLHCPEGKLGDDMEVDDVIQVAMNVHRCILDFYRENAANTEIDEVKAIFENLAERSEQELHKVVRNAQLLMDI